MDCKYNPKKTKQVDIKRLLFSFFNYNKITSNIVNSNKFLKKIDQILNGLLFKDISKIIKMVNEDLNITELKIPKQPKIISLNVVPPPNISEIISSGGRLELIAGAVCSASEIWLNHNGPASDAFQSLRDKMDMFYNGIDGIGVQIDANDIHEGGYYIGQYFDECHRVKLLKLGLEAEVFHVDYGSREMVPIELLRPLLPQFAQMPAQAFRASLTGVYPINVKRWSTVSNYYLEMNMRCKRIWANLPQTVVPSPNGPYVELYLNCEIENGRQICLNTELIRLWHAVANRPPSISDNKRTVDNYFTGQAVTPLSAEYFLERDEWVNACILMNEIIPEGCMAYYESINMVDIWSIGDYREVTICSAKTPAYFIMLLVEQHEDFENLKREMTEFYECGIGRDWFMPRIVVRKNQHCAARTAEGIWLRALIMQSEGRGLVAVKMLDTEAYERISINDLKPLWRAFGALPAQAHMARLAGVKVVANAQDWPHSANRFFTGRLKPDKVTRLFARAHMMYGRLSVELFDLGPGGRVNIAHELIRAGMAEPTPWLIFQAWAEENNLV